jgi:hypothetical protein
VAGIVLDERQENKFKEIGVKDSKAICKYNNFYNGFARCSSHIHNNF